ncbi:MAG TPA: DNA polymerase/3'-5' exonuclease PolX [Candidatus Tyrphobacter sp.]|nr:DNA polymerase/3'-5' exonuclease PolX [Candidatus Tyrphobacter sp.]
MTNEEIARILKEIAEYLEIAEEPFKPRAYERAAQGVDSLEESAADLYKQGGLKALMEIPGVGASIAEKIEELLKTGRLKYYEKLKSKLPVDFKSFSGIEGLGPKSIAKLYKKLKIKNAADLKKAVKAHKIRGLEGFGEKSEEKILAGLEFLKITKGRFPLGEVWPLAKEITSRLEKLNGVERAITAGSLRRRKETIGDIDILTISKKPKSVMDYFVSMPEVARIIVRGETKSSVKLKNGLNIDLRVVGASSYGAALNYFTGSKSHNVALREIALKKGRKLNEYGLFDRRGKQIAGETEENLYARLGLRYIEPELREETGEIEASRKNSLPKLIGYGDLRGDLQTQTDWTDGANSIEEMALAAHKSGLEYMVVTDHTKRLAMAHGLDEKRIRAQGKEIDEVNKKLKKKGIRFIVLRGSECDILKDGALDLPDEVLAELDVVGASIHSFFNLPKKEQTERIIKAMRNPNVDILFHPTGRILNRRPAYDIDLEAIIKVAKETGTILEIDAFPDRLDLNDERIRLCVESGVRLAIDSDAHAVSHFGYLEYGLAQARRGWAGKSDIINSYPLAQCLDFLKSRRRKKRYE